MKIKTLTIFCAGTIAILLILPIIQSLTDLILTSIEVLKVGLNVKIMSGNVEIEKLQNESEPVKTQAIGFEVPDEYEDEYDEDYQVKQKSQIGFR